MLTCIACSKQQFASGGPPLHEPPEDEDVVDGVGGAIGGGAATPSTRHAIKALTAQVGSLAFSAVFVVLLPSNLDFVSSFGVGGVPVWS